MQFDRTPSGVLSSLTPENTSGFYWRLSFVDSSSTQSNSGGVLKAWHVTELETFVFCACHVALIATSTTAYYLF